MNRTPHGTTDDNHALLSLAPLNEIVNLALQETPTFSSISYYTLSSSRWL